MLHKRNDRFFHFWSSLIGFFLVSSLMGGCNSKPTPNEYVTYEKSFFSFSKKGEFLSNKSTKPAVKRGFADFTGDGIEDLFEIRKVDTSSETLNVWIFEGYVDSETKLLNITDPYELEIKWPDDVKWGKFLEIEAADVNGDGFADLILSEFIDNWRDDEFKMVVSLNKGVVQNEKKNHLSMG